MPTSFRPRFDLLRHLMVAVVLLTVGFPALAEQIRLDGRSNVDLWPAITVMSDPTGSLSAEQVALTPERFSAPGGTTKNLGRRTEAVWLRAAVVVEEVAVEHRVLAIDYPPLNRIDLYVLRNGQVQSHQRMGNELRQSERAVASRIHAAPLVLSAGEYEILLRVDTTSTYVLPVSIKTVAAFVGDEADVHLTQGILVGLALGMLLYSLANWVNLRDSVFLDYALLLIGNSMFGLAYFGLGAHYFWPDTPEISVELAPMGVMLAVMAGTRFIRTTLRVREISRLIDLILQASAAAALLGLFGLLFDLMEYRTAQALVTVLGLTVLVIALPVAALCMRRGNEDALFVFLGWGAYAFGSLTLAGIVRGLVEPSFWTQHLYPIAIMFEMSAWMAVLSNRVKSIHQHADRARVENDTLRNLAHTDMLTGLPNRRGLNDHLKVKLHNTSPDKLCAVYMMDLDGFKPVNDQYGHDAGDTLLVAVGKRLTVNLRSEDVVARLGGDEFVAVVSGLPDEAAARALGQKLLAAIDEPFVVDGQHCKIGLTIGYALAPIDGQTADELLKRADTAMYAGKHQGRNQVQRGSRASVQFA
ncbi:MAG: diguanylate cyclase [Burkholderiaceae bacterium]